jgi:DNA-binding response OmpR family regulator
MPPLRKFVRQQGHILVVETDDLIRGLLECWLGEAGYSVAARSLRKLPADRMRERLPHLIIVDVPSPRSAEGLIESVKEVYPSPILLLSARFRRGLGASMDVASRLGVRKVLPKPFTRAELLAAVRESIGAVE